MLNCHLKTKTHVFDSEGLQDKSRIVNDASLRPSAKLDSWNGNPWGHKQRKRWSIANSQKAIRAAWNTGLEFLMSCGSDRMGLLFRGGTRRARPKPMRISLATNAATLCGVVAKSKIV